MSNDSELLEAIAAGNENAFKLLFEKHRQKIFNYLLKITKSKQIAEEILLDVFLKIWMVREMLHEVRNMDGFLHKIAYNKAMNFFRISAKDANLQKIVALGLTEAKALNADHKMIEGEYNDLLVKALSQLSPRRRMIFDLSRTEGFTHEQIADRLRISRHTVRNTITETLKGIRHYLNKNGLKIFVLIFSSLL